MTRAVDVTTEGVRIPLARSIVADIAREVLRAERVSDALVSITFVSTNRITALNRGHLNHPRPTDVISFGFARAHSKDPVIGDIYIAPAVARANALTHAVPVREEIARLVVHGVLHVLGFDHPDGARRTRSTMWRRQEALLRRVLPQRAGTRRGPRRARAA